MREQAIDQFTKNLSEFHITLNDKQYMQFLTYYDLLVEWNERMNLTAITDFDEVLTKHFLDSLSIVKLVDFSNDYSLIDVGTGAGFPGIPIKILAPNCKVTLLDSLNKRITFLDEVIHEIQLKDIDTYHGRAEDFAKPGKLREQYDICVSRAVANLSSLTELCVPFIKVGGRFISYKSEKANEEILNAKNAFHLLGVKNTNIVSFKLPSTDFERNLIELTKIESTSKKYPRKAGTPVKQPL